MRFGRRAKHRNLDQPGEASAPSGGSVATEERSALLSFPGPATGAIEPGAAADRSAADPTQDLLSALGRYQSVIAELSEHGADGGQWTDDVMDQLVEALEVAIQQEWDIVVEALTDTGRILHAYEDAGCPDEATPFLHEAYDILCLMVGDLIVGDVRDWVSEKWRNCYEAAKALVDSAAAQSKSPDAPGDELLAGDSTTAEEEMPFDLPSESDSSPDSPLDDLLPALDELPQLDEMLELGIESQPRGGGASPDESGDEANEDLELFADFGNVTYLETKDSPPVPEAEKSTPADRAARAQPTPLTVEILDRICDQLSLLEGADGEDFSLHIQRVSGGVGALRLEAEIADSPAAIDVCALMEDALALATASMGRLDEHFMDVAYGYCGVFIDALKEEDADSANQWKKEAIALVETWESPADGDDAVDEAAAPKPPAETGGNLEAKAEAAPDVAESEGAIPPEKESTDSSAAPGAILISEAPGENGSDADTREHEPVENPEELPAVAEEPDGSSDALEPTGEDTDAQDAPATSFALLESAQKAAAEGDGASARFYALQAAAQIASDETAKAQQHLESTEARLKQSWDASASAREEVTRSEQAVTEAASKVSEAEASLGKSSGLRAERAQEVGDLEEKVLDLEEQMKALVERHKEEEKKVTGSRETLLAAEAAETEAEGASTSAAGEEKGARVQLESARQGVKDLQRKSTEMESEVSGARENLSRQKNSLEDIEGTIAHIRGEEEPADSADTLLF